MITFLESKEIWPRITKLARKTKKSLVAVAYFGQGAKRLVPLNPGSVLVVDCHPRSVKGGRTCPYDLLALITKNVEVHSCSNLHAKAFVFGNRAIIGSTNASNLSKTFLIEAAVETTEKEAVEACREFINGLTGDRVSPKYAKQLCKKWNPPKVFVPRTRLHDGVPRFHPLWVVPLVRQDWDKLTEQKDAEAEPVARKKLKNRRRFKLDKFQWDSDDRFLGSVKTGDQLLQAIEEGKSHWLHPISRVIHLKRYSNGGKKQLLVYLELPQIKPARRRLQTVRTALGALSPKLIIKRAARRVTDPKMAHALFQLWPGQD
jgi:hypothetical protein